MGYEVAGSVGFKLAYPEREVICFVGDGSYMLANSELATAVMRRIPFTVVLTDNRGYGCINRLQTMGCGGEPFNNMYVDCNVEVQPEINYVKHAEAMGAYAVKAKDIDQLEAELAAARTRAIPTVIVIETIANDFSGTGLMTTAGEHGYFWDVAVPQIYERQKQRDRFTPTSHKSPSRASSTKERDMPDLLKRPFGAHGMVHQITPESAGWRYVGFDLIKLRAGETWAEATGDHEVILVMVEGKAKVQAARKDWGELGERMNVFEKTPPHCLYVPNDSDWSLETTTDATIAVCKAPGESGHEARKIGPEGIELTQRGEGVHTRYINNIAMENEDYCDSLLVIEVFAPAGHWSSFPSHRLNPADGLGIQRVYTDDLQLNETMAVHDGDVVCVPCRQHPCGAPYGFEMY